MVERLQADAEAADLVGIVPRAREQGQPHPHHIDDLDRLAVMGNEQLGLAASAAVAEPDAPGTLVVGVLHYLLEAASRNAVHLLSEVLTAFDDLLEQPWEL